MEVYRAANADAQVDRGANEGEHEVVADARIYLPASFDLVHPEDEQAGHDDAHAGPDKELDVEVRDLDEIVKFLRMHARGRTKAARWVGSVTEFTRVSAGFHARQRYSACGASSELRLLFRS